jgi:hypothetical protein
MYNVEIIPKAVKISKCQKDENIVEVVKEEKDLLTEKCDEF